MMPKTIREVVAVFDDTKALDDAVSSLETRGFDHAAFSVLASEKADSLLLSACEGSPGGTEGAMRDLLFAGIAASGRLSAGHKNATNNCPTPSGLRTL